MAELVTHLPRRKFSAELTSASKLLGNDCQESLIATHESALTAARRERLVIGGEAAVNHRIQAEPLRDSRP
jgi:hypothetical protein